MAVGAAAIYLANAWHLHQPTSPAKRARMKRRVTCLRCGIEVAAYANGKPYRHWSRRGRAKVRRFVRLLDAQ